MGEGTARSLPAVAALCVTRLTVDLIVLSTSSTSQSQDLYSLLAAIQKCNAETEPGKCVARAAPAAVAARARIGCFAL